MISKKNYLIIKYTTIVHPSFIVKYTIKYTLHSHVHTSFTLHVRNNRTTHYMHTSLYALCNKINGIKINIGHLNCLLWSTSNCTIALGRKLLLKTTDQWHHPLTSTYHCSHWFIHFSIIPDSLLVLTVRKFWLSDLPTIYIHIHQLIHTVLDFFTIQDKKNFLLQNMYIYHPYLQYPCFLVNFPFFYNFTIGINKPLAHILGK